MKTLITLLAFTVLSLSVNAQLNPKDSTNMQNSKEYIRNLRDVDNNYTAYTEITINASAEIVRKHFLNFKKWPEWNTVIPKISVKSGDINDLSTKPTLDLMLNFSRKKDPSPAPLHPNVFENTSEVFNWGVKKWLIKAEHVFIFESINNGKQTRLVHYEQMRGIMKSLVMSKKTKVKMVTHYNTMNESFKIFCEENK